MRENRFVHKTTRFFINEKLNQFLINFIRRLRKKSKYQDVQKFY